MTDLRARFVERFGADLAERIERGIDVHAAEYPIALDRGSDPFRFSLVWAVGFECLNRPEFRREHGITAPWADLAAWIRSEADLASFDGTMDAAGHASGFFRDVLETPTPDEAVAGAAATFDWLLASAPVVGRA
jgi:hypothetical protein